MFASITIFGNANGAKVAVPRDAVIFEAGTARVWIVRADRRSIEQRRIKTGLVSGSAIEAGKAWSPAKASSPRAASSSIERRTADAGEISPMIRSLIAFGLARRPPICTLATTSDNSTGSRPAAPDRGLASRAAMTSPTSSTAWC